MEAAQFPRPINWRNKHATRTRSGGALSGHYLKKNPTEYLRSGQLYFDTIMFTGEAMRHLIAEVGIEHVVMGTDCPFPWNTAPVDHILSIPGISDADKVAMLGATAARLLGIDC